MTENPVSTSQEADEIFYVNSGDFNNKQSFENVSNDRNGNASYYNTGTDGGHVEVPKTLLF